MSKYETDSLVILGKDRIATHCLRGLLAGRPAFLVGGGPSARDVDISKIEQRGVFSLAVNNMAGWYNASAFVCSDPPSKFHHGIWRDPTTMKFVPIPKYKRAGRGSLREKIDQTFHPIEEGVLDCPNVYGFGRRAWWTYDDTFFTDPEATWGNNDAGVRRTKNPKVMCTFLLALRLLRYLGASRVFLLGVDFNMRSTDGYAFGQGRTEDAASNNNNQYNIVKQGLAEMTSNGVFDRAEVEIYNCNRFSGLRCFPHVPYDMAVAETLRGIPQSPWDLSGWYEK